MLDDTSRVITRADEINHAGAELFNRRHIEAARMHFLAALALEPSHADALQNLGAALRHMGHQKAALSVARRSLRAGKNNPFCRSNFGVSLLAAKRYDEAREVLAGVLGDLPESGPSWHNYALVLYMTGLYEAAIEAFDKAIGFGHNQPQVYSDRALALLSLGKLQEGLEAYEVRWSILTKSRIWDFGIPEWQGEPLSGRSLLVHHEQGYGDSLMLCRFLLCLKGHGANITLAVPEALVRLFQHSFDGVAQVVELGDRRLNHELRFDYHTPMLSLIRHLGFSFPGDIPGGVYLTAPVDPITAKIPAKRRFRVGLCWSSGDHGPVLNERRRQVPLTEFLPLTELPGLSVVSLQKDKAQGDIAANGMEGLIYDLSPFIEDFASTAAAIAELDIVISVDSAVAHLAGAMGKRCLMLAPYVRCWRWWSPATGWPWYDKMEQFRQSEDGTWTAAVAEVTRVAEYLMQVDT